MIVTGEGLTPQHVIAYLLKDMDAKEARRQGQAQWEIILWLSLGKQAAGGK